MAKIRFRLDDESKKAFREMCEHMNVDMSQVLRGKVRNIVQEKSDVIPDHLVLQSFIEKKKEQHKPYRNIGHLPSNFHEQLTEEITKPYPMPVDEFKREYFDPYFEQIERAYDEETEEQRKKAQLAHAFELYRMLHPETDPVRDDLIDSAIHVTYSIRESEDMDTARDFVGSLISDGILPKDAKHEVLDAVRDMKREEWQSKWNDATLGDVSG